MSCVSKSISDGYIVSSKNIYNVNDTVTYACNSFYTLSGNAVATCLDTFGTWSAIPSCKLSIQDNAWFWMTVGLASLVGLALLLILLIVLIRYCCCHRRKVFISEYTASANRYGESCGPCCGFVDYKGCCSLYGCCGFYGCAGGAFGCCRCCRELPNESESPRSQNSSETGQRPPKKKVAVRQTQTSPTPTDSTTMTYEEKKKIAKINEVYIISTNVESTQTAPLSTKPPNNAVTPRTEPRDQNGSVSSEDKNKKVAKALKQWMPHSHPVRPINTSTK